MSKNILIKQVRVKGFRGLQNLEVNLEPITILTGINNSGKTSFLKALQLVFGNRQFLSQEDFTITNGIPTDKIIIDTLIIPTDDNGIQVKSFNDDYEILFTEDRIKFEGDNQIIPLRTVITFDLLRKNFKSKQYMLKEWPGFNTDSRFWFDIDSSDEKGFKFDEIPFFYMDAQRDILEDIHVKSSYLGKMISKIEYDPDDIKNIEKQIEDLNKSVVGKSEILTNIKTTLKELDTAIGCGSEGVDISPFAKKIRDLNKSLSIYYADGNESFSMEYHGMGTRSWSSLLTLKAFISLLEKSAKDSESIIFPILAIEEPEAHLHPNAQKRLYSQINSISGQKIVSTHSPYIAGSSNLNEIRSFYKKENIVKSGQLDTTLLVPEDIRKIDRMVMNTRGEILFSKVLIFFEGETEEQALPIFAKDYFEKSPLELGIDFIAVGGYGNYLPFIRLAQSLNIPWFILSDAEKKVKKDVKKALKKLYNRDIKLEDEPNVIFLNDDCDFENYLLEENYLDEIKLAFEELHDSEYLTKEIDKKNGSTEKRVKTDKTCNECKQSIYEDKIRDFTGDDGFIRGVYSCMGSQKAKFGPVIADVIIRGEKSLPSKIIELFTKVNSILLGSNL